MIPEVDNNHVVEAGNLLTSRYKDKLVIAGIVKSFSQRFQEIEDEFWKMISAVQLSNHPMVGGPWDVLDKIGDIVGAARNGLDDSAYLARLRLQIQVNRSRGTPEDVIALGRAMAGVQPPGYLEMPPAAFYLWAFDILPTAYPQFGDLLKQVRAAATYGLLIYTTWAPGNDDIWSSIQEAQGRGGSWGSRYDPTAGGLLAAAVVM